MDAIIVPFAPVIFRINKETRGAMRVSDINLCQPAKTGSAQTDQRQSMADRLPRTALQTTPPSQSVAITMSW